MNKMILLLFSVFALLHITTSDRNLRDGSYGSCNHSSRYLSSNTDFLASTPHRLQRLLYEIRTLPTPEKNPNFELTQLTERQKKGHIESRSKYYGNRKTFRRNRNRILTTLSQEIVGRRYFRERIYVHKSDLLNNIYKKVGFSSRYNNRKNEAYTNRFEDKHRRIIGFNYSDRADRNRRKHDLLEYVERKPQRHAIRDSLRDYSNYDRYTERKVVPQKLVLYRNAYRKANLQNIRRIITDRETTFNQFAAKRFSAFNTYRNLAKELSQKEFRTITSRNEANKDKMNINYSKRISNAISRRLLIRDADYFNSLTENRKKHESVYNREVNEIGRGTRNIKLELHEASRFRDYVRNKRDQTSREYDNYNVRYNRDMKERIILQENNDKERRVNDNRERINFEETDRRVNIFDSRNSNDPRNVQRNWLSVRRSFIERSLERDNERRTQDNLSMEHSQGRDQIRGSRKIRRNIDMSSDRILRRDRKLADSRLFNENVTSGRRQPANRRDQNYDKILDTGNVRRSLEKQRSLREDQNRMTTRMNIHLITPRPSVRIDGTSTENVNYQRSRSVRNRERCTNNRLLTRKVDDERRKTKQSQEDRSLNTRRLDTTNENQYPDFYGSESSKTHKVHYGSNVFEIKLRYLFYALQFAYLLSVIMQIPKINKENKQRNRIVAWMTPAEYFKID